MASSQMSPQIAPQQQQKMIFDRYPTLRIGLVAGASGMFLGAASGIVLRKPPIISSVSMGIMFSVLGPVFYKTREFALPSGNLALDSTPSQKVKASAIGGACTGAFMGVVFFGPKTVLPAIAVSALSGAGGQQILNKMAAHAASADENKGWSLLSLLPLTKLTDQEYEEKLEEKILKFEASIALIDESIAALEAQRHATEESAGKFAGEQSSSAWKKL